MKNVCVLGGDVRQIYIAEKLCEKGINVVFFHGELSEEKLSSFDGFLLPVPMTKDGYRLNSENEILLMRLFEALPCESTVIGGKIPQFFTDHLVTKNITVCDFYEDKEYVWKNAKITAEGALMLLMRESEFSLTETKVLVCGYGRIGKCLSRMLCELGAYVTVAARKKDVVFEASVCGGCESILIDPNCPGRLCTKEKYDVIFNTVPGRIFDDENFSMIEGSIYIELAGAPYGGDCELMKNYSKKYILASGLPGKYAPRSDAESAFKVIVSHIFEEERI